jgi:sugar phosphate isomerase/epimerase
MTRPPTRRIGLSSYAYRWSGGSDCASCQAHMDARGLIATAAELELQGVQICDNMPYQELSRGALKEIRREADDLGIFIETGARGTDPERLTNTILASSQLGSRLLRVVAEIDRNASGKEIAEQLDRCSEDIGSVLAVAHQENVRIALENHATLSSPDLLHILETIGDDSVGICLDTMNSVMLLEHPLDTVRALAPHALCVHFKDFRIEKRAEDFRIVGVPLGEGLLDVVAVLRTVEEHHLEQQSLHLELYVGRKETCEATRIYEDECVRRSAAYLKKVVRELG